MTKLQRSISAILGTAMCGALLSPTVFAQAATAQPESESLEEIVITGSRIAASGFTAPTPTTMLGAEEIQARGAGNIAEIINEVPAFRPSNSPAAAARGSSAGNFVDLRGLNTQGGQASAATTRTLVLVNGRRFVGSNTAGAVDLNLVPSSLIERTEIVTGGASAAWGSDAIAGVVNIILKDKLQGVESNIAYGQSEQSDNKEKQISFGAGTAFASDRGHVVFGAEYVDNEGVPDSFLSRDWGRQAYGEVTLSAARPAGTPQRIIAPDVRLSDVYAPGGVIVGGPLDGITFLGGQATGTFVPGLYGGVGTTVGVGGTQMIGGGNNQGVYNTGGSNLVNPLERYALMGRVSFDFSDALGVWAEASHGNSEFNGFSASRRNDGSSPAAGASGAIAIRQDNFYLPASVAALMAPGSTINVGRVAYDAGYGNYPINTQQSADRFAAGLKGSFGADWSWDAYYQWGKSNLKQHNVNTLVSNYRAAVDVVNIGGIIQCRPGATLNAADPGCVPFNIFGQNAPSQAAIDYVTDYISNDLTIRQDAAAVNINGTPFSLWAGPVAIAAGIEYRKEKADAVVDDNSLRDRFDINNPKPINGTYNTKEVYGEVAVPLLKDKPFAHSLELNAAFRLTDYSTSGSVETWKVGFVYYPVSDLHFRASQSRDIRAPNIGELFSTSLSGRQGIVNPFGGPSGQVDVITSGNPNLLPEEADTTTAGIVYEPSALPGFRASLDYFNISIEGAITGLTAQNTVDACRAGNATVCSKIVFFPDGVSINRINITQANFNSLKTNGVDLELGYDFDLGPGRFGARALATYVDELASAGQFVTSGRINFVKQSLPQLAGNLRLNYDVGPVSLGAQARYVGPTVVNKLYSDPSYANYNPARTDTINDNTRPSVVYVNLTGQYRVIDNPDGLRVQLYAVVNNLLDKDPPPFGGNNPIGASLYDLVGRAYKVGVRANF